MCGVELALTLLLAGQADPDWKAWIAQLDGFPDDAPVETFLKRPALYELIAAVDRVRPALIAALSDPRSSDSVRAGAAYAVVVNGLHRDLDDGPGVDLQKFLSSPSRTLRVIAAAGVTANNPLHPAGSQLSDPASRAAFHELFRVTDRMDHATDFLPEAYARRRTDRLLELVATVPAFPDGRPGFDTLCSKTADLAWMTWAHLADRSLRNSAQGHAGAELLLHRLRSTPVDRLEAVSSLMKTALALPGHDDASHGERGPCPLRGALERNLLDLIQTWIWQARDPYFLSTMVFALERLRSQPEAIALLRRLAKDHVLEEVRELAQTALEDEARLQARLAKPGARPGAPGTAPATPAPRTPESVPTPTPSGTEPYPAAPASGRRWMLGGVFAAVIGLFLLLRRSSPA